MFLKNLTLVNFKNHQQSDFQFVDGINCFVGKNGTGKSNALDAIHYLSMCKSYINSVDKQNITFNENFFVIQGTFEKEEQESNIYCGVKVGAKKIFRKNKVDYEKLSDHIGVFPSVVISPYDRDLISEGSEVRRKWIDSIISQIDRNYLETLVKYNKVVEQRNALLKQQYENGFFDRENIEIWNYQLELFGTPIYNRRKQFVAEFVPLFKKYYYQIGNSAENVTLDYKSQLHESDFPTLLESSLRRDSMTQYTNVGVHKDDLLFMMNENLVKKIGSQGQQKTFLIALRLAQFEWLNQQMNVKPIFLLDDIFDKLDNSRVEKLIHLIADNYFGQVFISDTDKNRLTEIFQHVQIPINFIETQEI
ncbi:MAG TPA: DNA replication and repair protein RecF [Crocinitomicaceae bacterium]|nr:DNA replication and repair protein RecF [Crocinitomicaceae bacterium]